MINKSEDVIQRYGTCLTYVRKKLRPVWNECFRGPLALRYTEMLLPPTCVFSEFWHNPSCPCCLFAQFSPSFPFVPCWPRCFPFSGCCVLAFLVICRVLSQLFPVLLVPLRLTAHSSPHLKPIITEFKNKNRPGSLCLTHVRHQLWLHLVG